MNEQDYRVIANYLIGNPMYCFELEGYYIPKYFNKVDLQKIRVSSLSNKSSYVKNFEDSLKKEIPKMFSNKSYIKYLDNIQEFIIPIENVNLWKEILLNVGLGDNVRYNNTTFFKLDYLFPYLHCCIEIDSNYHFPKAKYDLARDLYISSMYGIRTVRLLDFGKDSNNKASNLKFVKELIKEKENYWSMSLPIKINFNFYKSISENFITLNRRVFDFIELIKVKLGSDYYKREILIKLSDYTLDFPELNEKSFVRDIIDIMWIIFNKRVCLK